MTVRTWLDTFFRVAVFVGGVDVPDDPNQPAPGFNFVSGASVAYNETTNNFDITLSGGGGGSAPTGTGFAHVTSGAFDAAAVTFGGDVTVGAPSSSVAPVTVVSLQGNAVAATTPTTGQALVFGSAWTPVTLSQDATLLASGAVRVQGLLAKALPSLAAGALQYNGSAWTLSTTIVATGLSLASQAEGAIAYFDGANWVVLAPGTSGNFLQTQGAGAIPRWAATSGGGFTAGGDLTGSSTSQEVAGLLSHALPAFGTGVLGVAGGAWTMSPVIVASNLNLTSQAQGAIAFYNGSAWVVLGPGTAGDALTTHGAGANPTWAAVSGGGITAITNDVTASGSGSVSAEVVQLTGSSGDVAVLANTFTWAAGAAAKLQQTAVSGAAANFSIAPQASTGGLSGSLLATLAAPGGGSTEATFGVTRAGSSIFGVGALGGAPSYTVATLTGKSVLSSDGSTLYLNGDPFGSTAAGTVRMQAMGLTWVELFGNGGSRGVQIGYPGAPDFGGGDGVLGISKALTIPTSAVATAGDVVVYGADVSGASYFGINAAGILLNTASAVSAIATITASQAPASTDGTTMQVVGGAAGSGGIPGGASLISGDNTTQVAVSSNSIAIDTVGGGAAVINICTLGVGGYVTLGAAHTTVILNGNGVSAPSSDLEGCIIIGPIPGSAPTDNLGSAGILYVSAGALKWRGGGGTVTTLGVA